MISHWIETKCPFGCVEIDPLKSRHDLTKLDLTVLLLSFWCIDNDLSIRPISLTLYMNWVH